MMDIIIKNMCDNYNDNFDIKKELQEVTPLELIKAVPELIEELRAERHKVAELQLTNKNLNELYGQVFSKCVELQGG